MKSEPVYLALALVILLFIASVVSIYPILSGNFEAVIDSKADSRIVPDFQEKEWLEVIVEIKTPPEDGVSFKEWMAENKRIRDSIIQDLPEDEADRISTDLRQYSTGRAFRADITHAGLITLTNDERVEYVVYVPWRGVAFAH